MDGPFTVKVSYINEGVFNLVFLEKDQTVIALTEVSIRDFLTDFLIEINDVIRYIKECNWNNEEIEELKYNYQKIKLLLKTQSY